MSAFAIFAFVLTIAYFIYYAVVIYMDDGQQEQEQTDSQGGGQSTEATSVKQGVQADKKADVSDDSAEAVKEKLENMLTPVPVKSELEVYLEDMYPILENGGLTPAGQQISATPIRL